jgi:hypothetical protein
MGPISCPHCLGCFAHILFLTYTTIHHIYNHFSINSFDDLLEIFLEFYYLWMKYIQLYNSNIYYPSYNIFYIPTLNLLCSKLWIEYWDCFNCFIVKWYTRYKWLITKINDIFNLYMFIELQKFKIKQINFLNVPLLHVFEDVFPNF